MKTNKRGKNGGSDYAVESILLVWVKSTCPFRAKSQCKCFQDDPAPKHKGLQNCLRSMKMTQDICHGLHTHQISTHMNTDGRHFSDILVLSTTCIKFEETSYRRMVFIQSESRQCFSQSSTGQFQWACAQCSLRFLFVADEKRSMLWFSVTVAHVSQGSVCIPRCFSTQFGCKEWVFKSL